MTNMIDYLEASFQQKAHEADRKLDEAISQIDTEELRDISAFNGNQPVGRRKAEYEKDIEYRRDTFLSIVKQVISGMNADQRRDIFSNSVRFGA